MPEQNWDYLHIVCDDGRPRFVNRREIPDWQKGPTLFEAVNYLFRTGWELVDTPFEAIPLWHAYKPGIPHHFRRPQKADAA